MDKYGDKQIVVTQDVRVDPLGEQYETVQQYFTYFVGSEQYSYTTVQDLNFSDTQSPTPAPDVEEHDVNEFIIEAVRGRPALWNIRDKLHKNRILRNRMCEEVAAESNFAEDEESVAKAHKIWDCLKANYLRWKKKALSGSAGGKLKEYKYARQMSFLDDTAEPRRSSDVCGAISEEAGDSSKLQEDRDGETPRPSSSNRKRNYQQETLDMQREYVWMPSKRLQLKSCASAPAPNLDDVEINNFCSIVKCHLKRLNVKARVDVQAQFLQTLGYAMDNEVRKKKFK